ncbi:ARM repeat-containing protein [Trametopsis cervina]|nr:ARM repeat-containing protein [Trametopsis cervina]
MGQSEIQSWIASTSYSDDNDSSSSGLPEWRRESILSDWPSALQVARKRLLTSSTKIRQQFLKEELLFIARHGDLTLSQTLDIFKLLTLTYSRYVDVSSREAVEAVGIELVRRDELRGTSEGDPDEIKLGVTEQIVGWLAHETSLFAKRPSAYPSADMLVLLSWLCGIYSTCVKYNAEFALSPPWISLVASMATLLDLLLDDSLKTKPNVRKSALVRTRRALRSHPQHLPTVVKTLVATGKSHPSPLTLVPLMGTTIDVQLRLKNVKDPELKILSSDTKTELLSFYANTVLMSRVPVKPHITGGLHDFIHTAITEEDLRTVILPTMEKALLRSPEISLNVISSFFVAYSHSLDSQVFRRLLTPALSSARSTNPTTRAASAELFKSIVSKISDPGDAKFALDEILNLPKSGKTSGADHRISLYTMLGHLSTSLEVSPAVAQSVPALLAKETHEVALSALASSLTPHLVFTLAENLPLPSDASSLIAKGMNDAKPSIRRAFCSLVGNTLWQSGSVSSSTAQDLVKAILPSIDNNLKTVAGSPTSAPAGPLEGYIALAVLLGPVRRSGKFEDAISRNTHLHGLLATGAKPSFLLWDKVYQKLVDPEDERWLLRAVEEVFLFSQADLKTSEAARAMLGNAFLHLAVESPSTETRRLTLASLSKLAPLAPELVAETVAASLRSYLAKASASSKTSVSSEDGPEKTIKKDARLCAFLLTCADLKAGTEKSALEKMLVDSVVFSHHPLLATGARIPWIELCQAAHVDPHSIATAQFERILKNILEASGSPIPGFVEASYRSVTTMAFVAPEVAIPRIMAQIQRDIDAKEIEALTDEELAIWATPEGTTYIDVLANKKPVDTPKKGKGYKDAQWEAEVRKTLAEKKKSAGTSILSKQDQALVQAQLDKEATVRKRVESIKVHLHRGLHLVDALVKARSDELHVHLFSIVSILLSGAFGKAAALVGDAAFQYYIGLSECCTPRLESFNKWIGVATLRSLEVGGIPEEIQAEPINSLLLRVLHRVRFIGEQGTFDVATYSYMSPLLQQILRKGGIGLTEDDDPLEQVALALDIIRFHCGEFSDAAFPRKDTIEILLHVIRQQPKLAKDASSALISIGQAIHETVTRDELNILLRGTLLQEVYVRNSVLQTLQPFDLTDLDWTPELWISCHDSDEQNARLANHLWEDNGLDVPENYLADLIPFLEHENLYVRNSTALALSEAVEHWPKTVTDTVLTLEETYRDKAKVLAPEFDQYGMVVASTVDRADPWPTRIAIALALELLAPHLTDDDVEPFIQFLIQDQALGDRHSDVRRGMLQAGTAVIDLHGSDRVAGLIGIFEGYLSSTQPADDASDFIKEAVVILFGRVAKHLDPKDARVANIVERLIEVLSTPSEQVQIAISDCLSPLIQGMGTSTGDLVDRLFDQLQTGQKYATRRGAAYGLAGVVKGAGVSTMKDFRIIERLRAASEDKKRFEARQGAMFAFETFSNVLGRLFEPYILHILPLLLTSFGDATADVREAVHDTARVIMGNLSGYGVKTILPSLLSGLDDKQWRSKKGSIELLGMIAYCAPKQLSQSLPVVIPRLTEVLTDSHIQVRTAANKSLKQFGEVISNPEIQSLVPIFLKAMVDPSKTPNALTALLKTSFMHYIDHSSLALVVPIIERGLRERSAETKKKAAQIVGNLASLTDSKDFVPYLSELLPMVHVVLVDPVPEARATAAKSLGTLVERLGEVHFPDLVPNLLRTLKTDTSGVDRQGAAQGLSEVLAGLGMERMEGLLPDIIANAQSPRSTVREGFMSLLVFLPATFGTRFSPHLPKIIAPILSGLADVEDYVREAAMRAGRMIVTNYSNKAIDLLLPELERGIFDPGWRIRQSSITLVGELLFKVSGISGKAEIDDDEEVVEDTAFAESSKRALVEVLGAERRDRILSALYLARQDAVNVVRQSAGHIWKALVHNTPRTVREILPQLISQIIDLLSSDEVDQQETAARTTVELCRKSGEKILAETITILRTKSSSPDERIRAGVCLTLCELMESTTDAQREGQENEIITMVRLSLVDDAAVVRSAAAKAFDVLQEHIGAKAIDQTIPTLLEALRQPGQSSGTALQALREVMSVRASTVFPVLIPTLTAIPMTVFNARALASLVSVAGSALSRRLTVILGTLVKVMETQELEQDEELKSAVDEALQALLESISDAEGLNTLMLLLLGWAKGETVQRRVNACNIFAAFCEATELDTSLYRIDWIRQLLSLFDDSQVAVHTAAWKAFDVFVKFIPKDELEPLVVPLRRTIEGTGAPGRHVPGFSLPKGVAPTVPIIIAGLTTGSNEQREQAAYAIADLVERTEESAIKPFVVPFTGPLIRVATQAATYPPGVKVAILQALDVMLQRIPLFVKPFFPQLQRTFVKSASDPSSGAVRSKAAHALGVLMKNQPRVDPVITELITGAKANDESIASSLVLSLAHVVRSAKTNVGEKAREACVELVADAFKENHHESYVQSVATLFASLSIFPDLLKPIIQANLLGGTSPSSLSSHCILAALVQSEEEEDPSSNVFVQLSVVPSVSQKVQESIAMERPDISRPAREAKELLKSL